MTHPLFRPAVAALGVAVLIGCIRIVATYPVFSQTVDEPSHLAGGMGWLERGNAWLEPKHPPLARIAIAMGPHLAGLRLTDSMDGGGRRLHTGVIFREGNRALEQDGAYDRNLALARAGILPLFALGCVAAWLLAKQLFGLGAAIGAAAFASTSPILLAHGGLATTDMALAATFALALSALIRFSVRPRPGAGAAMGAAVALPLVTKLSVVLFLPAAGIVLLVLALLARKRAEPSARPRLTHFLLAAGTMALVIWATYRFSIGSAFDVDAKLVERASKLLGPGNGLLAPLSSLGKLQLVPAVEWFAGIKDLAASNAEGTKGYLLGSVYLGGHPLFFPVGVAVKTPLPLLLLEVAGVVLAWQLARRTGNWMLLAPAGAAAAILATAIPSNINIGVRHVLPIFLLLTPYAGLAAARIFARVRQTRFLILGTVLTVWYLWSTLRVHPDYLAYFNELALLSRAPVLVNSDLDWGQDAKRLVSQVDRLKIDTLTVGYFGTVDLRKRGLARFDTLADYRRVTGWVAVSINRLTLGRALEPASDQFAWLKAYQPIRTVGRSILLYRISGN